ncbi:uncharacterized protein LOC142982828 [Anticarsia gemmatalis]|uniref:uncharacterized protein LOC142982828 n=1 Tax=Anticarsia gemmatalis TaxID=129554 RepID=UPI003F766D9D
MKLIKVITFLLIIVNTENHHHKSNKHSYFAKLLESKNDFFSQTDDFLHDITNKIFEELYISEHFADKPKIKLLLKMHDELNNLAASNFEIYEELKNNIALNADNKTIKTTGLDDLVNEIVNETPSYVNAHKDKIKTTPEPLDRKQFDKFVEGYLGKIEKLTVGDIFKNNNPSKLFQPSMKVWEPPTLYSSVETRRIYHGKKTSIKTYPFMVSLHIGGEFKCAGSIISEDMVLTAASCLQEHYDNKSYSKKPKRTHIRHGSDWTSKQGKMVPVYEVHFHPRYNLKNLHNNLAILRFKRPLKDSRHRISSERIRLYESDGVPAGTNRVTILGWGNKHQNAHSNVLGRLAGAHLDLYPIDECKEIYSEVYVTDNLFCAGFKTKGGGACNRDVGGPGVINDTLTGVISFGPPICGAKDSPTVFTKVGHYIDWIKSIVDTSLPKTSKQTKPSRQTKPSQTTKASTAPTTSPQPTTTQSTNKDDDIIYVLHENLHPPSLTTRFKPRTTQHTKPTQALRLQKNENEINILKEILREVNKNNNSFINDILYNDLENYFEEIFKSSEEKNILQHPLINNSVMMVLPEYVYTAKPTELTVPPKPTFEFSTFSVQVPVIDSSVENDNGTNSTTFVYSSSETVSEPTTSQAAGSATDTNIATGSSVAPMKTNKDLTLRLDGFVTAFLETDIDGPKSFEISDNYEPAESGAVDSRERREDKNGQHKLTTRRYGVTELDYGEARPRAMSDSAELVVTEYTYYMPTFAKIMIWFTKRYISTYFHQPQTMTAHQKIGTTIQIYQLSNVNIARQQNNTGWTMWVALKSNKVYKPLSLQARQIYNRCRIGNRDWVGFGINGCANYKDDAHFPFPAVRFKENTRDICALREKEKGDWRMLCCEEKKALYRASFCQTFSEFQHNTGQWKGIMGGVFLLTSFTFWVFMFNHYYVVEPLPASLARTAQKAQLRRMLELRVNPIDGLSSKWDYDNDRWKY